MTKYTAKAPHVVSTKCEADAPAAIKKEWPAITHLQISLRRIVNQTFGFISCKLESPTGSVGLSSADSSGLVLVMVSTLSSSYYYIGPWQ